MSEFADAITFRKALNGKDVVLTVCIDCGVLVPQAWQPRHTEFHEKQAADALGFGLVSEFFKESK